MTKQYKEGDLQVWWISQIPMHPFTVDVKTIEEAMLILGTLAQYDIFQFQNNVKPDYSNAGGLNVYEKSPDALTEDGCEWCTWYDPETGQDIDEIAHERGIY